MDCCQIVTVINFFLPILLPIVALLVLIPQSLREYQKWESHRLTRHLSAAIMLGTLSFYFLTTFYLICMGYLMGRTEMITTNNPLRVLVLIGLILLAYYILVPQTIKQYDSWKDHRKPGNFSLMVLFGFISFFVLTFFYFITLRYGGIFPYGLTVTHISSC